MSYILDALKKAEQERQRGSVPDLLTVQTLPEETQGKRIPRRYFIFALIFAGAIISTWGLSRLVSYKTAAPSPDILVSDADKGRAASSSNRREYGLQPPLKGGDEAGPTLRRCTADTVL